MFKLSPQWSIPQLGTGVDEGRLLLAVELAIAAGNSTLRHFHERDFEVQKKADRSPVTIADKEAERLIRDRVSAEFSCDAILGEEFGEQSGTSEFEWIIDPIDGTKSFICGVPLYSTLVAVCFEKRPFIGIIYLPALGQIAFAMQGCGAWKNNSQGACVPTRVSQVSKLAECALVTTQIDSFGKRNAAPTFLELDRTCYISRTWGDGYGYYAVATGQADLMIDPIVNAWDVAAVMPVVIEAGGQFSDWEGQQKIDSGHAVGSNGLLHSAVIDLLKNRPTSV